MDADPVTTLTLAVLLGGGSGGLVSWWIKGVIDRSWKDRARELDAKLSAQARETEQLRAHSLGLEAERRRNFEARRAELCAALFASANEVMGTMLRTYPNVVSVAEGPEEGQEHPQYAVAREGIMKISSALEELFVANQTASLFMSETSHKRAGRLWFGLDKVNIEMLTVLAGMPYDGWDTGPIGKALESLGESLRQDLLAPVPSPRRAKSIADEPATGVDTPPQQESESSPPID